MQLPRFSRSKTWTGTILLAPMARRWWNENPETGRRTRQGRCRRSTSERRPGWRRWRARATRTTAFL
jgi:hypothetical protein